MKQSKLFTKTQKSSKEFDSKNATLLTKGGFIEQQFAGVYNYLPLGLIVLNKIENIVRQEMSLIANEIFMPTLALIDMWEKTGRFDTVDVLFKASGANEISKKKSTNEYVVQGTHEETVTPLVQKFVQSYKDLPVAVFQIQTKFRNEARAKSGILRGREFRMKDLYSFHSTQEDLENYYEIARQAYVKTYERLGFVLDKDLFIANASGGDFTPDFSHEFQVKVEIGEDEIYRDPVTGEVYNKEVTPSQAIDPEKDLELKPLEEIYGENIIGVDDLVNFLKVAKNKTVKTLIYKTNTGEVIVAAVRGDYEVNEIKLSKIAGCQSIELADEQTVIKTTGSKIGYAGIINLPNNIRAFIDDSIQNLTNFETGSNKENYHSINVNWGRDIELPNQFYDIKMVKQGDKNPATSNVYEVFNASEVGNIFKLGTKFSKAFDFKFKNDLGEDNLVIMGCYGIGTSRLMGVIVEKFHDDKGILWPESIAPCQVHLLCLNPEITEVKNFSENIYQILQKFNIEVLFDDREEVSNGERFADADLIGIPYRVVISKRTLENGGEIIEVKKRSEKDSELINIQSLIELIKK